MSDDPCSARILIAQAQAWREHSGLDEAEEMYERLLVRAVGLGADEAGDALIQHYWDTCDYQAGMELAGILARRQLVRNEEPSHFLDLADFADAAGDMDSQRRYIQLAYAYKVPGADIELAKVIRDTDRQKCARLLTEVVEDISKRFDALNERRNRGDARTNDSSRVECWIEDLMAVDNMSAAVAPDQMPIYTRTLLTTLTRAYEEGILTTGEALDKVNTFVSGILKGLEEEARCSSDDPELDPRALASELEEYEHDNPLLRLEMARRYAKAALSLAHRGEDWRKPFEDATSHFLAAAESDMHIATALLHENLALLSESPNLSGEDQFHLIALAMMHFPDGTERLRPSADYMNERMISSAAAEFLSRHFERDTAIEEGSKNIDGEKARTMAELCMAHCDALIEQPELPSRLTLDEYRHLAVTLAAAATEHDPSNAGIYIQTLLDANRLDEAKKVALRYRTLADHVNPDPVFLKAAGIVALRVGDDATADQLLSKYQAQKGVLDDELIDEWAKAISERPGFFGKTPERVYLAEFEERLLEDLFGNVASTPIERNIGVENRSQRGDFPFPFD